LAPALVFAQSATVTGTVTDAESGEPLPGANVQLAGLNLGAATNVEGSYTISEVPAGEYTLRVSFVGFQTFEEPIELSAGETLNRDVELQPDYTGLEEVVVTGIASQTSRARAEVTVSKVDTEELQQSNSYSSVNELLGGKIAGVNVSSSSGNVGGGFRFDVRSGGGIGGGGQPVIYIDGVRVDNAEVEGFGSGGQGVSTLANLNPEDIESVEVLKGPAGAALYGTSGSNGVVLITTKTGRAGQPLSVRYKGVVGVNQQIQEYDYATAGTPEVANDFFRDGGIQEHTVSASGGSDIVRYFTAFSFRGENGTLRNNTLDRNSFRANFEAFPLNNLTLTAKAGYSRAEIGRPQNDNNLLGYLGNTLLFTSPFAFTDSTAIEAATNVFRNNNFTGSVQASYQLIDGLELRASVGYDGIEMRNDETLPADQQYSGVTSGERSIFVRRNEQFTYDVNARYSYSIIEGLSATSIVGGQAFDRTLRETFIQKQNFATELTTNVGAGSDFIQGDEDFIDTREAGIFAQQEFNYQNTYFLTFGGRQDFATQVGSDAGNIFYPKLSGAVRLDQFNVTPSFFDLLKVRAAYGETGQLPGRLDGIPLLWTATPSGYGSGAVLDFIGNADIEPERVRELEVGVDADLFGRVSLAATYFRQRAAGSIIDFAEAPSTGLTASDRPFNVGEKSGQGVELDLSVTPVRRENISVTTDFIYAYTTNTIDDLGGAQPIFDGFDVNVTRVGLPQSAFYTYGSTAQFVDANGEALTGDFNPSDVAGFNIVPTATDANGAPAREFFGTPTPNHNGSVSVNVRLFQNLQIYGLIDYAADLQVFNSTKVFQTLFGANKDLNTATYLLSDQSSPYEGLTDEQLRDANVPYLVGLEANSVAPGGASYLDWAEVYAGNQTAVQGAAADGNFISDADYIKLREVSLSYNFSSLMNRFLPEAQVESITLGLSARNIFTTTNYDGIDPEVNFTGARDDSRGTDFLTLAPPRTLTATLNLRF
jgi:TonB-dependent SusC/RagA subfamily outer membrane receptor